MPAPLIVEIVAGTWTKVATDVLTGQVHKKKITILYWQTYRPTGDTAPTDKAEGVPAFVGDDSEKIDSNEPIDVYIWADTTGSVRVDV